jgi:hypothetical protein
MIDAMRAALKELEDVLECINQDKIPFDGDDFHETLRNLRQAIEQAEKESTLQEISDIGQEAHTDHPMRHWDRTCPACVAEAEKQEPYADKANQLNNDRIQIDPVTGDVSIGTPPKRPVKSFSGGVPWYATEEPISATTDKAEISATADNKEIERLKVEVKRLQDLAEYRLKLLMQMPENKPWVNLTDEEIDYLEDAIDPAMYRVFARRIEAKLKEKNNG